MKIIKPSSIRPGSPINKCIPIIHLDVSYEWQIKNYNAYITLSYQTEFFYQNAVWFFSDFWKQVWKFSIILKNHLKSLCNIMVSQKSRIDAQRDRDASSIVTIYNNIQIKMGTRYIHMSRFLDNGLCYLDFKTPRNIYDLRFITWKNGFVGEGRKSGEFSDRLVTHAYRSL